MRVSVWDLGPIEDYLPQRKCNTLILCGTLLFAFCADSSAGWLPARILGLQYPQVARAARIEGTVVAICTVQSDGSIGGVEILSDPPLLASAVKANLIRWTFRRTDAGSKAEDRILVTYTFDLKGDCDKYNRCKEEFWYEPPDRVTVVSEMPNLDTSKVRKK